MNYKMVVRNELYLDKAFSFQLFMHTPVDCTWHWVVTKRVWIAWNDTGGRAPGNLRRKWLTRSFECHFVFFFWCQDTQTFLCGGRHKMVTWSADAHEEDSDDDDADDGSRAVGGWRWLHHDPMTYNRQKRPVPPPSPLPAVPSLPRGHWETSKYR